jgi:hypothetical protein
LEIQSRVEKELREEIGGLQPEEAAVLAMLRSRLKRAETSTTVQDGTAFGGELAGLAEEPRRRRANTG